MNKLPCLLLLLAACGGGGTEIPDAGPDAEVPDAGNDLPATISLVWEIYDGDTFSQCPTGATTAAIHALRDGDSEPYVDLFVCSDRAGDVTDLPPGDYVVWIDLTDDTGAVLYAQSEVSSITLGPGTFYSTVFEIDGYNGSFDLSWEIEQVNGTPTTCAAVVGQNGVSILSTLSGTTTAYDSIWNCVDGEAPTILTNDAVPIGDYVVVLSLLDQADNAMGDAPEIVTSIDFGNQFRDLGLVTITLF